MISARMAAILEFEIMTKQLQPVNAEAPETLLRGWAKAYRETPEHRFPSDPHAEFFPVDLEMAANEIDRLRAQLDSDSYPAMKAALEVARVALADGEFTGPFVEDALNQIRKALATGEAGGQP
jgi:hypothetical protein